MKKVRITAVKKAFYSELSAKYENQTDDACMIAEGQTFVSVDGQKPQGICDSAWETLSPFVKTLAEGGGYFWGNWMKNPHSAMLSCNDGFRPVSFLVETIEEETTMEV